MSCYHVVFCVFLCGIYVTAEQKCSFLTSETRKFSVASRRNQTGHWIGQVTLNHGANEGDSGFWDVDVDHITTQCDDDLSVTLVATVTASPEKSKEPKVHKELDSSYKLVPGLGNYKLHTNKLAWPAAREMCATEGGHLLILNSDAEWATVKQIWEKSSVASNAYLHIGITDFLKEGQFVTLFGEHLNTTGYSKWKSGEPNSGTTANCGAVDKNGQFEDSFCTNQFAFVCEARVLT